MARRSKNDCGGDRIALARPHFLKSHSIRPILTGRCSAAQAPLICAMPSFPIWKATLDAAEEWKLRCLLDDGSVLAPGESLWTDDHIQERMEHFAEESLSGAGQFMPRLESRLEPASAGAKRLAAEMIWVMMLVPVTFGQDTKVKKIRQV